MTKYFLRALLCLSLLLPIGVAAERSFNNFSNVVVLGNSLSDTGIGPTIHSFVSSSP